MVASTEVLTLLFSLDLEKVYILCVFASTHPHHMTGRFTEICFLSFFFPLLFRGLLGSLFCVLVQAITLAV